MSTAAVRPTDQESTDARLVRSAADAYVGGVAALDPLVAVYLGLPTDRPGLSDLSPTSRGAMDGLSRATLAELDRIEADSAARGGLGTDERRCARLLRERLGADLATSTGDEYLREVMNEFGVQQRVQGLFLMLPKETAEDWAGIAGRMSRVPETLAGLRESLAQAAARGEFRAAPRQVRVITEQLATWRRDGNWFAEFCADAPELPGSLRGDLDTAAAGAATAAAELERWLTDDYLPQVADQPDGVGPEHYRTWARFWNGADIDPVETYAWGWSQYQEIRAQMQAEAHRVLSGATVREAMDYLDQYGEAVEGVEEVRLRLQQWMDDAISQLDGSYFDLADPVKVVEARIAPAGSAAAPYYTSPSQDFSRPGRTWLPTQGRTRFPLWSLRSVWHHEGVPGHHLHLAQWRYLGGRLSMYQTGLGGIDACKEGWALYAERLMDELGHLPTPGDRLGFLDWQLMRAIRVVVDLGMHLGLTVPADSPVGAGERWTAGLGRAFLLEHSGQTPEFVESEIVRYLGLPGQAISYKLGERAWLTGLARAKAAHAAAGRPFDLKSWHMAALSLGSLGLDDLTDELAALGLPPGLRREE